MGYSRRGVYEESHVVTLAECISMVSRCLVRGRDGAGLRQMG